MFFIVDICAVTTTEEYTPLHFAARFCPHSSYEDVSCGTATEQTAAPTESGSINRRFSHQMTCEETMSYIMKQRNVDVSHAMHYLFTITLVAPDIVSRLYNSS